MANVYGLAYRYPFEMDKLKDVKVYFNNEKTKTDAEGKFEFLNVPLGTYELKALQFFYDLQFMTLNISEDIDYSVKIDMHRSKISISPGQILIAGGIGTVIGYFLGKRKKYKLKKCGK